MLCDWSFCIGYVSSFIYSGFPLQFITCLCVHVSCALWKNKLNSRPCDEIQCDFRETLEHFWFKNVSILNLQKSNKVNTSSKSKTDILWVLENISYWHLCPVLLITQGNILKYMIFISINTTTTLLMKPLQEIAVYLIIWMMQEVIRTSGHSHVLCFSALSYNLPGWISFNVRWTGQNL